VQGFVARYYRFLFIGLLITLLGLVYYVGYLQGQQQGNDPVVLSCTDQQLSELAIPLAALAAPTQETVHIQTKPAVIQTATEALITSSQQGKYVGSKNGTKYYLPNCSTVKRIKPANLLWFRSEEDAQLQGYSIGSC
jgi:hypothetical protein